MNLDTMADLSLEERNRALVAWLNDLTAVYEKCAAQRDALLAALHEAHELLFHYNLTRQPNGVDWGPVEMLKAEALDKMWSAIIQAQPELAIRQARDA